MSDQITKADAAAAWDHMEKGADLEAEDLDIGDRWKDRIDSQREAGEEWGELEADRNRWKELATMRLDIIHQLWSALYSLGFDRNDLE